MHRDSNSRAEFICAPPSDPKFAAPAHISAGCRRGSDLSGVELPGDGIEACMAGRLDVSNDRQDVCGLFYSSRLIMRPSASA